MELAQKSSVSAFSHLSFLIRSVCFKEMNDRRVVMSPNIVMLCNSIFSPRVCHHTSLLDCGYEKPAVKEEIEHVDLPPMVIQIKAPDVSNVC